MKTDSKLRNCLVLLDSLVGDYKDLQPDGAFVICQTREYAPRFLELLFVGHDVEREMAHQDIMAQLRRNAGSTDSSDDFPLRPHHWGK